MSDRLSFSLDNFYVGLGNVGCPTIILSTEELSLTNTWSNDLSNFIDKQEA